MFLSDLDAQRPWLLPLLLALLSAAVLGLAWLSELYGANLRLFGNQNLRPCPLCLVQRYPYALLVGLALAASLLSHRDRERTLLLSIMVLVLVFGAFVSAFHVGVEYGWWTAGAGCSAPLEPLQPLGDQDTFILSAQTGPPMPSCSDAAWRFPSDQGLSMAGYNFLLSTGLALALYPTTLASLQRMPEALARRDC